MMEPAGPGGTATRAFLRVGGATLARHQLALMLTLGCEKIICLARALDSDVLALQHAAEGAGMRFHAVTGARGLMGLVAAVDEVFALSEGVLPAPDHAAAWFESGNGVAVQPAEAGLAAGFERIDAISAAGGAMRIHGRLFERLADLPSDCDALSALQRIALQAGVPQRRLPDGALGAGRWLLVRDEAEAHMAELSWIRLHTASDGGMTPSALVARGAVRAFGPTLLHAGSGGNAVTIAAGLAALIGLGAGWFGLAGLGLGACVCASLLRRTGGLLSRVERLSLRAAPSTIPREAMFGWLLDGIMATIIAWKAQALPGTGPAQAWFAPLMLIALVRLVPRALDRRWTHWLEDRALLALILTAAAIGGALTETVYLLAVVVALVATLWPDSRTRLTRA